MTDLEKAIELARKHEGLFGMRNREECCVAACQEMAEWADEHPRKNLVDIDKAVRWIKDNANKFVYVSAHTNTASINEHLFAEEFAEAMSNNDVVDACDTCKDNQYCSKSNYVKSHCCKRK